MAKSKETKAKERVIRHVAKLLDDRDRLAVEQYIIRELRVSVYEANRFANYIQNADGGNAADLHEGWCYQCWLAYPCVHNESAANQMKAAAVKQEAEPVVESPKFTPVYFKDGRLAGMFNKDGFYLSDKNELSTTA